MQCTVGRGTRLKFAIRLLIGDESESRLGNRSLIITVIIPVEGHAARIPCRARRVVYPVGCLAFGEYR
jgi:hypothetical protein